MKFWVSERCLGGEKTQISQERSKRIDLKLRGAYIYEYHKPRLIESYRGLKTHLLAIELAIEDLTRGFLNKEAWWIEIAIEELSSIQKFSRWIEVAIKSYRECDKKKLKSSIGRIAIERYRDSYQDCSKIVFQGREKHRYECNQTCYSNKDPRNILSSQNHLSTRKMLSA